MNMCHGKEAKTGAEINYRVTESELQHHWDVLCFKPSHIDADTNISILFSEACFDAFLERTLKKNPDLTLTTVGDDPDRGVPLSKTSNGSETHLVGFRFYQLSQVVCHELPFADSISHRNLLLPPPLQAHLKGKTAKMSDYSCTKATWWYSHWHFCKVLVYVKSVKS